MRLALFTALVLAGCQRDADPADVAEQVKRWAEEGIKGEVALEKVHCERVADATFTCQGTAVGGGSVLVEARQKEGGFDMKLAHPVVVSSLVEDLLEKRLADLELSGFKVECGERVRPATPGGTFKCAVESADGQVVNAADVTIKDAEGTIDANWLTPLIASSEVESKIAAWLEPQDIRGKVDCGQRNRFSKPEATFTCSVEGEPRKVVVTMTDYRGNLIIAFEGS